VIQRHWLMYRMSRRFMKPVAQLPAYLLFRMSITSPGILSRLSFSICRCACARARGCCRGTATLFRRLNSAAIRRSIERLAIRNGRFIPFLDYEIPFGFLRRCIFALRPSRFFSVALAPSAPTLATLPRVRFKRQLTDAFQYVPIIARELILIIS